VNIALAQINPIVGDLRGNSHKIVSYAQKAAAHQADLVIFPELSIMGYPPQDLLENATFVEETQQAIAWTAAHVPPKIGLIVGGVALNTAKTGKKLYNAAFLFEGGRQLSVIHKTLLPTYDVFDERRHFEPAITRNVVFWRDIRLGIHICEDLWVHANTDFPLYDIDPIAELAAQGADILINICASPFAVGKHKERERLIRNSCQTHDVPYVFVNQAGANTQLIFDGQSGVYAASGRLLKNAPAFEEALVLWDTDTESSPYDYNQNPVANLHNALVLGIRDYFEKTDTFTKALVGLSGGIDSAVTCALAVKALGANNVAGVTMPSVFSSSGSVEDSAALAANLGIEFHIIPIKNPVASIEQTLDKLFLGTESGVAEENIQARMRGLILMALSNKFGYLLLSTGNKSEMAVGYATLYGDMNGGLAVLGDVLKTQVYNLAKYINSQAVSPVIPRETIVKPPSAELRPDQTDQDSLPPYPVLDSILQHYIEGHKDIKAIVQTTGINQSLVTDILQRVDRNEYKRRQAPPTLRVTTKAFGFGRRLPVVMRWKRKIKPPL